MMFFRLKRRKAYSISQTRYQILLLNFFLFFFFSCLGLSLFTLLPSASHKVRLAVKGIIIVAVPFVFPSIASFLIFIHTHLYYFD